MALLSSIPSKATNVLKHPRRTAHVCSAQPRSVGRVHQAATQLVSLAAAALLVGTPLAADAASTAALASAATAAAAGGDQAAETVQILAEEEGRAAYKATLEENAKKAEILAKRQAINNRVIQLEDVIQRKLIEESANELAATGKGEVEVVARIQKQEAALTETEEQVELAKVQAEAALAREELVEAARAASTQQQIQKAGNSLMQMLGLSQ